uniref:Uncharacterized protein n=1 Tax=Arundo donax TaxID=35708 RepID=A0A0A9F2S6_ARUDO
MRCPFTSMSRTALRMIPLMMLPIRSVSVITCCVNDKDM